MKYLLLGAAFAGVLGYAWFGRGEANVYAMSPAEVYAALREAPVPKGNGSPFGNLVASVSGNGENAVYWIASGAHAAKHCEATITPEGADQSRLTAYCGGGGLSDGAAAGMVSAMDRKALIEHIDATLDKRPFDTRLAQGSTAAGWPSDARQPDGSYASAVGGAIQMEREMKQMSTDMDKAADTFERELASARAHSGVQFQPGQPMINVAPGSR
jgi:hypothetical protein